MNRVEIPIPPSVNNLWRVVGRSNRKVRVIKSRHYSAWLEPVVMIFRAGLERYLEPVEVVIHIRGGRGFSRQRDLDNCGKAVLDALRHAGRIEDDSVEYVRRLELIYTPSDGRPASCDVEVRPMRDMT